MNIRSMKMKTLAVIFLISFGGPRIGAQSAARESGFPDLRAESWALDYARREASRPYSWEEMAEAALRASGAEDGAAGRFMARLRSAAAELAQSPALPANARDRGEFLLSFLHGSLLKTYSELQTRMDELLTNGRYNCVSSSVLYLILGSSLGLEVRGVMTRDHAFVTVLAGDETIDVETTNPYGFDPGSRKEFHDNFGRLTGFAYVPARNYRDRVSLSPLELISLILSNRIVNMEAQRRYADAVPLAVTRARLLSLRKNPVVSPFFADPEQDARDRIYNFGISLVRAGREEDALRWAALASEQFPGEAYWEEFISTAVNNLMIKLIRNRRLDDARSLLSAQAPALGSGSFARLNLQITDAELVQRSAQIRTLEDAEACIQAVNYAETSTGLPRARAEEMRTVILIRKGEILAASRGLQEAVSFLEDAILQYGRNSRLDEALQVFRSNRVAEVHNQFAGLFNRGAYDEALRILREGLEEFPNNRQLRADLARAQEILKSRPSS
jgi:tetratricopeptide (TPR) repeat protein